MTLVKFTKKGIYCPQGKFYLDPWYPVDYAVISHGHADHARPGMKRYLCHHHSKPILKSRIGKDIKVESLAYNKAITINGVTLSFHPAGHIVGSAQIRLEYKGYVLVFSGDYKTQDDFITVPFEPVKCHTFITESTFGLPVYHWKREKDIQKELCDWVTYNQINNRTSVFFGYSLGKAQRLMTLLNGLDDLYVHSAIDQMNLAIKASGLDLPETKRLDPGVDKRQLLKRIVILPPALLGSKLLKNIPNAATAICSGWMQIRGNRRWQAVDAGFTVSDHADWKGLLEAVTATGAETVYVTHGSQAIFSRFLNEKGISSFELKTDFGDELLSDPSTESLNSESL